MLSNLAQFSSNKPMRHKPPALKWRNKEDFSSRIIFYVLRLLCGFLSSAPKNTSITPRRTFRVAGNFSKSICLTDCYFSTRGMIREDSTKGGFCFLAFTSTNCGWSPSSMIRPHHILPQIRS